jgi:hypothetical protein
VGATWVALAGCGAGDPAASRSEFDVTSDPAPSVAASIASAPTTVPPTTIPRTLPPTTIPPAATTTSASSTSTIPPTTIDPLGATRDAYSASDKAHDAALLAASETYTDEGFGGVLWENVPTLCNEQAAIDSQWAGEVAAMTWPADLQVYADDLVAALTLRADVSLQCSQLGPSFFEQEPIFDQQDAAYRGVDDARKAVRRHLGLGLGE